MNNERGMKILKLASVWRFSTWSLKVPGKNSPKFTAKYVSVCERSNSFKYFEGFHDPKRLILLP